MHIFRAPFPKNTSKGLILRIANFSESNFQLAAIGQLVFRNNYSSEDLLFRSTYYAQDQISTATSFNKAASSFNVKTLTNQENVLLDLIKILLNLSRVFWLLLIRKSLMKMTLENLKFSTDKWYEHRILKKNINYHYNYIIIFLDSTKLKIVWIKITTFQTTRFNHPISS